MDGTGILFREFIRLLPNEIETRVVCYPEDECLTYEQLAERVVRAAPIGQPYVIIAESFSGPIAALLAAHPGWEPSCGGLSIELCLISWWASGHIHSEAVPSSSFSVASTGMASTMASDGLCRRI